VRTPTLVSSSTALAIPAMRRGAASSRRWSDCEPPGSTVTTLVPANCPVCPIDSGMRSTDAARTTANSRSGEDGSEAESGRGHPAMGSQGFWVTEPHIKTIAWDLRSEVNDQRDGWPRRLPAGSPGCPEMAPPIAPRKYHDFNDIKTGTAVHKVNFRGRHSTRTPHQLVTGCRNRLAHSVVS
jgi:hypothetical protein